jgi:DNA-binding HxlR family transcriptional regulator
MQLCRSVSFEAWDRDNCSLGRAVEFIGDRHTMLILRESFLRERRFDRIQRNTGIARNILSDRLAKLVDAGILTRTLYQERPPRYEYRLTDKGVDLWPILVSLLDWGRRHGGGDEAILMRHKACGSIMTPVLACPDCGEPVAARDVQALAGRAALRESA